MRRSLFVLIILVFLISPSVSQKRPDSNAIPNYDLSGTWVTNEGEEVELIELRYGAGATLFAVFDGNNKLPNGGCKFGDHREKFIDGKLSGKAVTGTMWRCTESEPLFKGCHVPSVYTTSFKANVISKDEIYGTRRSEYWGPGGSGECKYTKDSSGDRDIAFGLTRKPDSEDSKKELKCPDTKDLELYKNVSTRATKMIDFVSQFVRDEKIHGALEQSSGALERISGGLDKVITVEGECQKLADFLNDVRDFQQAMDQINNSGCDTRKLAAGFDQLFRSAGKLGSRLDYLPELKPLFEILAQNQNFFTKVSGALDPEQRWANQFENTDGYIPNCPH
jgi:hypothetical protein